MALKDWEKIRKYDYRHKKSKRWVYIEKDVVTGNQYVLVTPAGYENGSLSYLKREMIKYMRKH